MNQKTKEWGVDLLYDCMGGFLYALGVCVFAKAADFAPGGVTGLSLMCNYLWGLPIGLMTILINIPIVLLSYKVVGKSFLLRSVRSIIITTLFIDVVFPFLPYYAGNRMLAAVFSGVFGGVGLAFIYMRGSSTGGTDFLVVSVKKIWPQFSMGQVTLAIDGMVILLGSLVYGDIDALLYGVVSTYAMSTVMDKILYGAGSGKLAIIITLHGAQVANAIDEAVGRGATIVRAIGGYSQEQRDMVLSACSKAEIFKVRNAVHKVDVGAFIMITEASEVFGEGFKPPEGDALL